MTRSASGQLHFLLLKEKNVACEPVGTATQAVFIGPHVSITPSLRSCTRRAAGDDMSSPCDGRRSCHPRSCVRAAARVTNWPRSRWACPMHDAAGAGGMNVHQIGALSNVLAIVVAITLAAVGAPAQLETQDQTLFRGRTDLVSVGVTVSAKRHRFINNLSAEISPSTRTAGRSRFSHLPRGRSPGLRCTSGSCSTSVGARGSISNSPSAP